MLILMSFKNEFYPTVIHMSDYLHLILRNNTTFWNDPKLNYFSIYRGILGMQGTLVINYYRDQVCLEH